MAEELNTRKFEKLSLRLGRLWKDEDAIPQILRTLQALDRDYQLGLKLRKEPEVEAILEQMVGRLAKAYGELAALPGKHILDIACGSNSSKLPASFFLKTLFGGTSIRSRNQGYTALFEPWFCRLLLEWGAEPVGIDFSDLEAERFTHYSVDLGAPGALDFLSGRSFDGIQDSRLFGSPEFTAQFPEPADRVAVAREIVRQEARLLKPGGKLIHSDAMAIMESNAS